MKEKMFFMIVILVCTSLLLTACGGGGSSPSPPVPSPEAAQIDMEDPIEHISGVPEDEPNQVTAPDYSVEQIQDALRTQFMLGDWGEGNPQVISAQRVPRDRDSMWYEPSGITIDLSNAVAVRDFRRPAAWRR